MPATLAGWGLDQIEVIDKLVATVEDSACGMLGDEAYLNRVKLVQAIGFQPFYQEGAIVLCHGRAIGCQHARNRDRPLGTHKSAGNNRCDASCRVFHTNGAAKYGPYAADPVRYASVLRVGF